MLALVNGDYVTAEGGRLVRAEGAQALVARVLMKLTARRGSFPFMADFGSDLWTLGTLPCTAWQSAAEQFAAEALADEEDLRVESVTVSGGKEGAIALTARLISGDEAFAVTVQLQQ
ncbi:MAG: hypothetical protein IKN53_06795 [Oscillibacter sp.]|nr:hypothetical protein [Oscillibacter sp.]